MEPKPLVVIVGETASGKSDLAMEIAFVDNGEIICADSRTIYRYLDIGTAKPGKEDRTKVRHHLVDIVNPDEKYNASMFKADVINAITDIQNRGKLPIMVGGSGLYIDSLIYDYQFRSVDNKKRSELEKLSLKELKEIAEAEKLGDDIINLKNKRYLVRAIESGGVTKDDQILRPNTLILGIKIEREILEARITDRVNKMIDDGFVQEVSSVAEKFGWECEAMKSIGYQAFRNYISGDISLDQARQLFVKGDLALAKKQRTWFKRNKSIQWVSDSSKALDFVQQFLNK